MFSKFKMDLESPYQLALLTLFNEKDEWTAAEMCAELNMVDVNGDVGGADLAKCAKYLDSLAKGEHSRRALARVSPPPGRHAHAAHRMRGDAPRLGWRQRDRLVARGLLQAGA